MGHLPSIRSTKIRPGRPLAAVDLRAKAFASPRLIGNRIMLGTTAGQVLEIDPKTHGIVGNVQLADRVLTAVVASGPDGPFYVGTGGDKIFALEREARE